MSENYEGQGGSYVIDESGARVLVGRTRAHGEPDPAPPVLTKTIQDQPADAGFFSPVAPADQPTPTE